MTLKVAGVDSSTQSVKIVVRDARTGELLASASAAHPDGTEVDPQSWWNALQQVISDVGGLDDVAAISIAGQQHGMIVLDSSGNVIRPALLWNDTRSSVAAQKLNEEFPDIHFSTGSKLVASFTASKLMWLRENEPENASKVRAVALPHDWLSWKLSRSSRLEDIFTDRSDASGTGYFDPSTNKYNFSIVESALGHQNVVLPRIIKKNEFGFTGSTLKIACGAGDNASGALGVEAELGDLVVSLGTSGAVFAVSETATHDATGHIAGFADASGHFLPLACTLNAAKILETTRKLLDISFDEFSKLALSAQPGAGGITFLPHFDGERTPNAPDARGQLQGATHENFSRANIARASIEGIIAGVAFAASGLSRFNIEYKRILLIGGAAQNPAVQQIASEIFGQEVLIPPTGEYVADGAARQAAWALSGETNPPSWKSGEWKKVSAPINSSRVRERYFSALKAIQ